MIIMSLALFFIIVGACIGYLRGWKNALTHLFSAMIAAAVSFLLTPTIAQALGDPIVSWIRSSMVEFKNDIGAVPTLDELIDVLPAAILAPLIFCVAYFIVLFLLCFFCKPLSRLIFGKREKGTAEKILGLPCGLVHGALSFFVLLVPILGFNLLATDAIEENIAAVEGNETIYEAYGYYDDYVKDGLDDSLISDAFEMFGGKRLFDSLASFKIDGERYTLSDEASSVCGMALEALPLASAESFDYGDEQFEAIDRIVDQIEDDGLIRSVAAEFVAAMAKAWQGGGNLFGITMPRTDELIKPIVNSTLELLADTTKDTLIGDLRMFVNMLRLSSDRLSKLEDSVMSGVSGENVATDVLDIIKDEEFAEELVAILEESDRISPVIDSVIEVGFASLKGNVDVDEYKEKYGEKIEDVTSTLNDVLDGTADREALDASISEALEDNNVTIPEVYIPYISGYLTEKFEGSDDVSVDDIAALFAMAG